MPIACSAPRSRRKALRLWQVGVMHTNYTELSRRTLGGPVGALVGGISHVMNGLLCSIHTHKVGPSAWRSCEP